MRVIFAELARCEFDDAEAFYELAAEGLGAGFRAEVERAVSRIQRYPQGWSVERGEIRRCPLQRFPYKLLYSVETDHIFVIAVAHQHRRPDYWVGR